LPEGTKPFITNGARVVSQTYYGPKGYNLMAYADDWQGGTDLNKFDKTFTLGEVKTEQAFSKQDYANTVQEMGATIKDAFMNDVLGDNIKQGVELLAEQGMIVDIEILGQAAAAELLLFIDSFIDSVYIDMMLGDTSKVTLEGDGSATTFPNNVAYSKYETDKRFSAFNGLWKNIFDVAATSPTAQQIQKVAFANDATAQVCTLTMSGTSGTATIVYKGLSNVATFDTSLPTTVTNFVTANLAAYAAIGVTISASTNDILFTEDQIGITVSDATGVNLTTNLAGSNSTAAATAASALSNNDCQTQMKAMWDIRPAIMRTIAKKDLVYMVTSDLWDNYEDTLQGNSTVVVESQRAAIIDGVSKMFYNGIEMVQMPIDAAISSYFGGYAPSRIILTLRSNIAPIFSTSNGTANMGLWFNPDANQNRSRITGSFGLDLWLPEYMVVNF